MMQHPQNIPVVEYYHLNGVNFSYCWRAGSTSVAALALNTPAKKLPVVPEHCVLLMKHPIERFRSAYMILPEGRVLNHKTGLYEVGLPPINDYINGVLDDAPGVRSPHCWPQLGQHQAVKKLSVFRLEGSTHLAGVPLPHLNPAEGDKPFISNHPREEELFEYYADDLAAWTEARPLTELVYPAGTGK